MSALPPITINSRTVSLVFRRKFDPITTRSSLSFQVPFNSRHTGASGGSSCPQARLVANSRNDKTTVRISAAPSVGGDAVQSHSPSQAGTVHHYEKRCDSGEPLPRQVF